LANSICCGVLGTKPVFSSDVVCMETYFKNLSSKFIKLVLIKIIAKLIYFISPNKIKILNLQVDC
jgi:hypothetical protein